MKEETWVTKRTQCPRCNSIDLRIKTSKVYVKTLNTYVCLLQCKNCGYRFRSEIITNKRYVQRPPNLVENYLNMRSIEALKNNLNILNIHISKATVHRWLASELNNYPTWESLLLDTSITSNFSYVMGLDLTTLKIKKHYAYYFHVIDFPNKHLAYDILVSKDAINIETILIKIRSAGYVPVVVVTDLAKELLQAIRRVYPNSVIQGCLFHLMLWLNKKLPTKNIDPEKAALWNKVKYTIMKVALAKNNEEQRKYIEKLKNLTVNKLDVRAKTVINHFLRNIRYYHTLNELMLIGCKPAWRYNNACERAMESVKAMARKMCGFKSVEHARKYINAMWSIKRKDKSREHDIQKPNLIQESLMLYFTNDCFVDLVQAASIMNMGIDRLKERLAQQGFIAVGSIAFSKSYLETVQEKVLRERPRTLSDMAKIINVDLTIASKLAEALNIKLVWKSLEEILLLYPEVTNEKVVQEAN